MIKKIDDLYGRQLPASAIEPKLLADDNLIKSAALDINKFYIHCNRCAFDCEKQECQIIPGVFYCPNCIQMGRLDSTDSLVTVKEPNRFLIPDTILTWRGHLTKHQQDCSDAIMSSLTHHRNHLLWAVTGAGKTEMLFLVIAQALGQGQRVAIASPRVDVTNELYPRLQEAFQEIAICLLHGKSEMDYFYSQLTICTTHQLMRFKEAFDLLVIDEVDAFPYVNNPSLHYASANAVKKDGQKVWMSATPTREMLKEVEKNHDKISYLPMRFHGHLLPRIKTTLAWNWRTKLKKGRLPTFLMKKIKDNLVKKQPFLLFVPKIADLAVINGILIKNNLDQTKWETVYSADEKRIEKVAKMRNHEVSFLITTTILERGVTFPDIDVIVLGADDSVFTTSSLVQIAGRVGRKMTRPTGNVDFIISNYSHTITEAKRQITKMNQLGLELQNGR